MSRLFIELYLDEDVDVLIAHLLRARGFDALTTQEAGLIASSDEEQLAFAARIGKTFLTHNRADFETLTGEYLSASKDHYGVIIAVRHHPYEILRRLLILLNQVTTDEMKNQLRYV